MGTACCTSHNISNDSFSALSQAEELSSTNITAPILQRSRNLQWYWNSTADLRCDEEKEWRSYTDVENEIIEDAYNAKKTEVEIDGDFIIDLKHLTQCKKGDEFKVSSIKRLQLVEDRKATVSLREERFSLAVALAPSLPPSNQELKLKYALDFIRETHNMTFAYDQLHLEGIEKSIRDVVEPDSQGMSNEKGGGVFPGNG
jgi:hypothetical protein